jgi:hypothetical protein
MIRLRYAATACLALALGAARADEPWRVMAGTWNAAGRRQVLPVEDGASASVIDLSGSVVLDAGAGLGRGFQGRVLGFDDGAGLSIGRWVWTDAKGDRVFGRLKAEGSAGGKRLTAAITGGTGPYAGIEGEFGFTWEYLLPAGADEAVAGRAIDLRGRVRGGAVP